MSSFENENSKNISQKVLNITRNKKINLANIEHFNTLTNISIISLTIFFMKD